METEKINPCRRNHGSIPIHTTDLVWFWLGQFVPEFPVVFDRGIDAFGIKSLMMQI